MRQKRRFASTSQSWSTVSEAWCRRPYPKSPTANSLSEPFVCHLVRKRAFGETRPSENLAPPPSLVSRVATLAQFHAHRQQLTRRRLQWLRSILPTRGAV